MMLNPTAQTNVKKNTKLDMKSVLENLISLLIAHNGIKIT